MKIDDLIKQLEYCKENVGNVEIRVLNYDNNSFLNTTTILDYEENCLYLGARSE